MIVSEGIETLILATTLATLHEMLRYWRGGWRPCTVVVITCCMAQCVARLETSCQPLVLWQLKLLAAFYQRTASTLSSTDPQLLSPEFLVSLQSRIETVLNQWIKSMRLFPSLRGVVIRVDSANRCSMKSLLSLHWHAESSTSRLDAAVEMHITSAK